MLHADVLRVLGHGLIVHRRAGDAEEFALFSRGQFGMIFSTNPVRSFTDRVVSTFCAGSPPRRSTARFRRAARRAAARSPRFRPSPALVSYELRSSPGPHYSAEDEATLASIPPRRSAHLSKRHGFGLPGNAVNHKIYVRLTTGNEAGNDLLTITRPF